MKHDEIFERLEPPSGGLAKLHERLDDRPRRLQRAAPFMLAAAAVAAIVVFVLTRPRPIDAVASARAQGGTSAISLGLAPPPSTTLAIDENATTAMLEMKSTNPDVKMYWVSSTTWRD